MPNDIMVLINTSGKLEGRGDSTYGGSEKPAACGGEFIMKASRVGLGFVRR